MARGELTADYDFELPGELIAQRPVTRRDDSRLLVVHRDSGAIEHRVFRDLAGLIPRGDAIVLNTSRVIRARLLGTRQSGAPAEILLLEPRDRGRWDALVKPGSKLGPGRTVRVDELVTVVIDEPGPDGTTRVRFESPLAVDEILERFGHVPLPPYIERSDETSDAARYQTVYAREPGSVAAPTAGLHFTPELLDTLAMSGVQRADVTLHVGPGTFRPVQVDDPAQHVMHTERFSAHGEAVSTLNETRARGGHVWAVGTTALRVLESIVGADGRYVAAHGTTNVFIRPPHRVRGADRLITNFHLPRSTLLMLVAAFAGYDLTLAAYREAIGHRYRFYSYGDAMCVI